MRNMEEVLQDRLNKYFDTDKIQIAVEYAKIRTYNIKIFINNDILGFTYQYEGHLTEDANLMYIKCQIEMNILEYYRNKEDK